MKKTIGLLCMFLFILIGYTTASAKTVYPTGFNFQNYSGAVGKMAIDAKGVLQQTYVNEYVYFDVDFGEGKIYDSIAVTIGVPQEYAGKKIHIRLGSPVGEEIATVITQSTGNWTTYVEQTTELSRNDLSGLQQVYIVFGSTGIGNLSYVKFMGGGDTFLPNDIKDEDTKKLYEKLYYLGIVKPTPDVDFFENKIVTVTEMLEIILTEEHMYKKESIIEKFSMDENARATYVDAACAALSLLEYDNYMDFLGKSASEYYQYALKANLFSGIDNPTDTKRVTKGMLLRFINNILDCDKNDVTNISGNSITYSHDEDGTLVYGNYRKRRGIVTGNEYTSLTTGKPIDNGCIEISSETYKAADYNLNGLLGFSVDFYYKDDDDTVYYACPCKNDTIYLTDDQIDNSEKGLIKYSSTGKTSLKSAKISSDVSVIYNGQLITSYTNDIFVPTDGDVMLINNRNGGAYNVIIINDTKPFVIDTISEDVLYSKNANEKIDLNSLCMFSVRKSTGEATDADFLKKLKNGAVLEVGKSVGIYGDVLYNITVCKREVAGSVESVKNKDDNAIIKTEKGEYALGGTVYFSDGASSVIIGDEIDVYFNKYNKVIYVNIVPDSEYSYGFITKPRVSEDDGGYEALIVGLFAENGEHVDLCAKDKVRIDGNIYKDCNLAYNALTKNETAKYILIRYKMNAAGKISEIDTPYDNSADTPVGLETNEQLNSLHLSYSGDKLGYKSAVGSFGGRIVIDDSTIVFKIPVDDNGTPDLTNKNSFRVGVKDYTNDEKYNMRSYNTNTEGFVAEVTVELLKPIQIGVDKIKSTINISFIDKICEGYDAEDDTVKHLIYYYQVGNYKSVYMSEQCANGVDINNFHRGDAVRFSTDVNGEINNIIKILDINTMQMVVQESNEYNAENRGAVGTVKKKVGDYLMLDDNSEIFNIKKSSIYIFNKSTGKFSIGNKTDILNSKESTDRVLLCIRYAEVLSVLIVKE